MLLHFANQVIQLITLEQAHCRMEFLSSVLLHLARKWEKSLLESSESQKISLCVYAQKIHFQRRLPPSKISTRLFAAYFYRQIMCDVLRSHEMKINMYVTFECCRRSQCII